MFDLKKLLAEAAKRPRVQAKSTSDHRAMELAALKLCLLGVPFSATQIAGASGTDRQGCSLHCNKGVASKGGLELSEEVGRREDGKKTLLYSANQRNAALLVAALERRGETTETLAKHLDLTNEKFGETIAKLS